MLALKNFKAIWKQSNFHKWEMGRMYFTNGKTEAQRSREVKRPVQSARGETSGRGGMLDYSYFSLSSLPCSLI